MRFRSSYIVMAVGLFVASAASAQTATQSVTVQVEAINEISVSLNSPTLIVNAALVGVDPTPVSDNSSTWAITTNMTGTKVTAEIDQNLAAGFTLDVDMAAPAAATSNTVSLSTVAGDAVEGITKLIASDLGLVYTLSATAAAGVLNETLLVTFTIVGGV
jgi:hypothetical protein